MKTKELTHRWNVAKLRVFFHLRRLSKAALETDEKILDKCGQKRYHRTEIHSESFTGKLRVCVAETSRVYFRVDNGEGGRWDNVMPSDVTGPWGLTLDAAEGLAADLLTVSAKHVRRAISQHHVDGATSFEI